MLEHPAGPERLETVEGGASAEVLRRNRPDGPLGVASALPPVELDHPGGSEPFDGRSQPQRHEEGRWVLGLPLAQPPHGPRVEVVVVIVRDDDEIDGRKLVQVDPRRGGASGSGPGDREGLLREVGVRQQVDAAGLEQEGGVTDPGQSRRVADARDGRNAVGKREAHRLDLDAAPLPDPAQEAAESVLLVRVVVAEPAPDMVRPLEVGSP